MPSRRARVIRASVVRACRRLDARGLVAGAEGNVSARVGTASIVITPAGAPKGGVRPNDLVEIHFSRGAVGHARRPSSELAMHVAIYAARPDVRAVVHAHPPVATGFAVARKLLVSGALAELAGVIGPVPLVPYRTPGTPALAAAVARKLASANVALLANHGAVAVGGTILEALNRMESLEQAARILISAHILGGVTELGRSEVHVLERARTGGARAAARRTTRRSSRRS